MTELKRPERYVQFESIKPKLKEITEFYTRKTADYQYRLKQLNEYADALENEISVLKETPKVGVLMDNTPKDLPEVPQCVDDAIRRLSNGIRGAFDAIYLIKCKVEQYEDTDWLDVYDWIFEKGNSTVFERAFLDGYTVEKEKLYILKHIDMSKLYTDVSLYLAHGFYKELDHIFYKDVNVHNADECHFTQSEIDKLNIGSYEKVEVEP